MRWIPASFSCFARATLMWPMEAQRLRFVCSLTRRAPSSSLSKSRLDRPWPWVTMQNRCAPAASAALACSRICSGSIIACIGVSASANRDCAQNPQSSAQPPDFALTSEHMSVLSPKCSTRAAHARSTSASMSFGSVSAPSLSASSRVISGGMGARYGSARTRVVRVRTQSPGRVGARRGRRRDTRFRWTAEADCGGGSRIIRDRCAGCGGCGPFC